jgi:GNAT superfamily N-acetyltransferase
MTAPPCYSIVRLPKSHNHLPTWNSLIAKQKALRLQSLLISPESFSSTYKREILFTDADWEARLKNPSAHTLIAVRSIRPLAAYKANDDHHDLGTDGDYVEGEWVGSAVLVGPGENPSSAFPTFDINALFVLPEARGTGLGAQLIESAASTAQKLASGASSVLIRASVAHGNERVLKLYERAGFVERDDAPEAALGVEARVLVKEM